MSVTRPVPGDVVRVRFTARGLSYARLVAWRGVLAVVDQCGVRRTVPAVTVTCDVRRVP